MASALSMLVDVERRLPAKKSATRDHIIPASFISFMPADRKRDFNDHWNIQPTCPKCNSEVRESQLSGWPSYPLIRLFFRLRARRSRGSLGRHRSRSVS